MPEVSAKSPVREVSISAVITRADGRVEDRGVISFYHKNPLRRLLWRVQKFIQRK